jgi:UDP-N-acetyl-D-mannosaminuronic acid dehydrogenase
MGSVSSVAVIGLGYVGLPTAALMARAGFHVLGVDIDQRIVDSLHAGRSPNIEPEVGELVEQAIASGRLRASTVPAEADCFIVCVPTPVRTDRSADMSLVDAAMRSIADHIRPGNLVILESTSPIGTVDGTIAPILREAGLDPVKDVDVCYCPERVFPGDTVREMVRNSRVVGGMTQKAAERAAALYRSFCEGEIVVTSAASAEFAKLMENTFRDVNIALANVFGHIAERAGIDVLETIAVANKHPRVHVHKPGAGVGGHCIPVDPWFLVHDFPEVTELIALARRLNDAQPLRLVERAEAAGLAHGSRVAILGVAYRGNIDDARESPSEYLTEVLSQRGYRWTAHDPLVSRWEAHAGNFPVLQDLAEALAHTDAAFLMTDHDEYRKLRPADFASLKQRLIVDGRRVLDASIFRDAGFTVVGVGAPTLVATSRAAPTLLRGGLGVAG